MTTQTTLAQPHSEDHSQMEPLPDPPMLPVGVFLLLISGLFRMV